MTERRSSLDSALDLFVYAPVGLVVELQRLLPDLAREGRTRVDQQLTLARFVGRLAVRSGRSEIERRLADLRPVPATPATTPPADGVVEAVEIDDADQTLESVGSVGPTEADLPLAGYDSLSASQVVNRLAALRADELDLVAAYESSHRRRRTILGKIDQLRHRVA